MPQAVATALTIKKSTHAKLQRLDAGTRSEEKRVAQKRAATSGEKGERRKTVGNC